LRPAAPARSDFGRKRWAILAVVLIGSLVGTFGNSMSNVALPSIMDHYGIGLDVGVWIVTIYVLLFSTLMPVFGRLGDMFGYKRIYLFGMVTLVISSSLAAVAPSIGWMIFWRAVAGISNAPTLPAIMAIIAEVFPPEERGGALGFWATANGAGHGFGPVISGLLVQYFGWPYVFWFNAGLSLLGVVLIWLVVPTDHKQARERFDFVGAVTLTAAMILVMFNLSEGLQGAVEPAVITALWAGWVVLFGFFIVSQLRLRQPFVNLRLFANSGFGVVTFVSAAQLFCLFGLQLLLPLFLINVQGRTTGNAGLLILPLATTLALISPGAGRLSDKIGSRLTCLLGMGLVALIGLGLALWTAATTPAVIAIMLTLMGIGMGMTQSPTANAVTLVIDKTQLGVALGIFNMLRFVSGTLGATIFGAVLERGGTGALPAFRADFVLFAVVAGAAALLALKMPIAPNRRHAGQPVSVPATGD
jgi:EmrB/QacA subfamily drug resistance transporter